MEKQCDQSKTKLLESLRKMTFKINMGACTLFAALGPEGISVDNAWCSELGIFLYGALFSAFSALIAYFSKIYSTKYFTEPCKHKEKALKNDFLLEEYVSKKYILVFLTSSLQNNFIGIAYVYCKKLIKYKEFKNPNEYNFKISQDFENASVAYCILSFLFFMGGMHLSQTPDTNTSFLHIVLNFIISSDVYFIFMMLVFGYAVYQMIINPIKHNNKRRKIIKTLESNI